LGSYHSFKFKIGDEVTFTKKDLTNTELELLNTKKIPDYYILSLDEDECEIYEVKNNELKFIKKIRNSSDELELSKYFSDIIKETENYAKLVDRIFDLMDEKFTLTHEFILDLHKQLFDWILDNAGSYRKIPITVSWDELAIFPSPDEVFDKMDDFINFVNTEPDSLKKVAKIHYDFVKIHPFEDGNGRIARLLMNLYLVRMNIFPIIFPLSVRLDYIVSLKSSKSFDDFYNFFLRQLYENLKDYKRFLDKF